MSTDVDPHRFRFGLGAPTQIEQRQDLVEHARFAESAGYDVASFPDHFFLPVAPLVAMTLVAEATSRLKVGTLMVAAGFRNPAALAKELATLDLLTDGRVEVGLGAGWMESEHAQAGLPFGPPGERVARLREVATILRLAWSSPSLSFAGEHYQIEDLPSGSRPAQVGGPPLLMGGGMRRVLCLAAETADIVTIAAGPIGLSGADPAGHAQRLRERVDWVRQAAGGRQNRPELHILLSGVAVCDDRYRGARRCVDSLARSGFPPPDVAAAERSILDSPFFTIGTERDICDQLRELRERLGISYFSVRQTAASEFAPVVAQLTGR